MRGQAHSKKRKKASKKQWREYLPVIAHSAAALYRNAQEGFYFYKCEMNCAKLS